MSGQTGLFLYLEVLLRVPVAVVADTGVRRGPIDAAAPGRRRRQENSDLRILRARAYSLHILHIYYWARKYLLLSHVCRKEREMTVNLMISRHIG